MNEVMLLAVDTSTRYAGVALLNKDGQLVQLLHWRSQQNHSVELLPTIESVLHRQGATIQDVTGIAVAVGPGSFSALRVGLSVAKGLAWARGLPLVAVTTLEAEAFSHRMSGVPVCAVMDAGRGQLAWALFEERDGQLCQLGDEQIDTPEELLDKLPSPALLCGEGLERYNEALSKGAAHGVRLALPYLPGQRVAALAYMGIARLQAGLVQDTGAVQPLYLRRPTITEPKGQPAAAGRDANQLPQTNLP
ncbi:MAG: tRNA (adenosine(37)-N6)-threonylcarbamoyltransferase complex dimerization subunit type 1 TsaB [Chloroflexota bacterium]